MAHSEGASERCVCPDCGYRCNACLGTNTLLSRDDIKKLKSGARPEIVLGRRPGEEAPAENEF